MKYYKTYVRIRNVFERGVGYMSYNLDFNMEQIKTKKAEKERYVSFYYEVLSKRLIDEDNVDMSLNEYFKRSGERKLLLDKISLEINKRDVEILDIEFECIKEEEKKGNIDENTAVKFISNFNKQKMLDIKRRETKYLETTAKELTDLKNYRILLGKEVFNDRITSRKLDETKLNIKDINKDVNSIHKKLVYIKLALLDNKYAIDVLTRGENKKSFTEEVKTFVKKIFK